MSKKHFDLPLIDIKPEKKSFPLYISKRQRKGLTDIWVCKQMNASKLIAKGLEILDKIEEYAQSEGPFSEKFSLKVKLETIEKLDHLANSSGSSRAEIVRRIIDKFTIAWEQQDENYRKMEKPFDDLLYPTAPSLGQGGGN